MSNPMFYVIMVLLVVLIGILAVPMVNKAIDKNKYTKARKKIFTYVEGYKRQCTGNNRFLVTVDTLQDVFREYDTIMITRVWEDLVTSRVIQQDPMDNEWCIR